jgi:uncharacterized protein (TIGR02271 family)
MPHNLRRLGDLPDYQVARGEPDVRGWHVRTGDGRPIGEVEELIVDTEAQKVRYLEVGLDRKGFGLRDGRTVSIPIESAQIDRGDHTVLVERLSRDAIAALPESEYLGRAHPKLTPHDTTPGRDQPARTDRAERDRIDRDMSAGTPKVIPRSEEELYVNTRRTQTGEVVVGKHVDTERVSQPVTVERERVHVERRPVEGGAQNREIQMTDDEIRIPVMEEELIVEKRPVVREELVISKETVRETERVEDDVRKERFDVRNEGRVTDDAGRARPRRGGE